MEKLIEEARNKLAKIDKDLTKLRDNQPKTKDIVRICSALISKNIYSLEMSSQKR